MRTKSSCGLLVACLLAMLAASADAARPARATFAVTLKATVTKDWNTTLESTEDGCTVIRRSIGHRTVTLRSTRPTRVVVALKSGKVSFSPSLVRFVTAKVTQTGENTTRRQAPCGSGTERERCRPTTRRAPGASFRFFRSGRNEISFRPAALAGSGSACPRESPAVRSIRPALRDAEGRISEAALARGAGQTAFASSEVATDLEGAETGSVVERINWSLTFARR